MSEVERLLINLVCEKVRELAERAEKSPHWEEAVEVVLRTGEGPYRGFHQWLAASGLGDTPFKKAVWREARAEAGPLVYGLHLKLKALELAARERR
ncbi:hypothetical protein ODS41_09975 [Pyrobaculum sp. 3827-6]|uniref:hypothetical protein n=1 Tax=Pyrobaculum sp. 3827-6 TaxID=2983604 RepID=UPI0021D8CE3B|nr:hypothetical protein [Pyrobaculum sp. 3827-6]MCU7788237.1 hypothetical protein [Pyrobaculum sp. 3827-6]